MQQISSEVLKRKTEWKKAFQSAKPFPHLVIPNILEKKYAVELLHALAEENFIMKEADLFKFQQTNDLIATRNTTLKQFYTFWSSDEVRAFMQEITGLKLSGQIDMAGTLYQDTDYLLCHDDQLEGRKIAYLLYLSTMEEGEGGSLNLIGEKQGKPTGVEKKIIPVFNALAIFEVSPISFHEVEEVIVDKQRAAIGGWFHG